MSYRVVGFADNLHQSENAGHSSQGVCHCACVQVCRRFCHIHSSVIYMRVLCSLPTPYQRIKKQLRTNTVKIGTLLTTGYTVFDTREAAVSAALGAATALAYVGTLSKYVDTIDRENRPFQSHVLLPGLLFGFETACIRAGVYEFDYRATVVCFLSYQLALMTFLYDVVHEMLLEKDENLKPPP